MEPKKKTRPLHTVGQGSEIVSRRVRGMCRAVWRVVYGMVW